MGVRVMRLRELDAHFMKIVDATSQIMVDTLAEAHGIRFLCPKCFDANEGEVGTHYVCCWFVGVDPERDPKPGRWAAAGNDLEDLTFIASPGHTPSVKLLTGCCWHGYIQSGAATIL